MNRRGFLRSLLTGAAGFAAVRTLQATELETLLGDAVVDPERLLWVPGQKTILLPPVKTFSLYSQADLDALTRAIGVVRFYDPYGRPRLTRFDGNQPHAVDTLTVLSDQEVRLAIETGHDLDPRRPVGAERRGMYDGRGNGYLATSHGSASVSHQQAQAVLAGGHRGGKATALRQASRELAQAGQTVLVNTGGARGYGILDAYRRTYETPPPPPLVDPDGREVRAHGQSLLHDADDGIVTTTLSDRGLVTTGHRSREGK